MGPPPPSLNNPAPNATRGGDGPKPQGRAELSGAEPGRGSGFCLLGRTHSTWEDSLSLPGRTLSTVALGGILPPATPCWGCVLESSFSLPRSSIQDRAGAIDEESAGMGLGPFTHQVKDCGPGGAEGRLHGGSHGEGLERGDWRGSAGTEAQKN